MPRRRLSAQDGQSGRRLVTISFIVVLCTWKMVYLQMVRLSGARF